MTENELYQSLGYIDDDLISESETIENAVNQKRKFSAFLSVAAAFAIIIGAFVIGMSRNLPTSNPVETESSGSVTENSPIDAQREISYENVILHYNEGKATFNEEPEQSKDAFSICAMLTEPLSENEMKDFLPAALLSDLQMKGEGRYLPDTGELRIIRLSSQTVPGMKLKMNIYPSAPEYSSWNSPEYSSWNSFFLFLGAEEIKEGEYEGLKFRAWKNDKMIGHIFIGLDFELDHIKYDICIDSLTEVVKDDAEILLKKIIANFSSEKGSFSLNKLLKAKTEYTYINEKGLELNDAQMDEDFGKYVPSCFPEGFEKEEISRLSYPGMNYLDLQYAKGYYYIIWDIQDCSDEDIKNIVRPEETSKYDLSTYPYTLSDYVDPEFVDKISLPVFRIEDVTPDLISKRCVPKNIDRSEIDLRVLIDDVIIYIAAEDVSPEWIMEQLSNLK